MRSASKFPISELTNSICLGMRVNMLNHVLLLMSFWLLTLAYLDLTELGMFRGCLSTWHALVPFLGRGMAQGVNSQTWNADSLGSSPILGTFYLCDLGCVNNNSQYVY